MTRPRLLDLFCGAGGAAMGYHRAGFDVIGVDINPQPHYPFEFHQLDAMAMVQDRIRGCWHEGVGSARPGMSNVCLGHFDAIHASPPCQDRSVTRHTHAAHGTGWMLDATIAALKDTGLPWVVENVEGDPFGHSLILCGTHFDLAADDIDGRRLHLKRHRWFATSHLVMSPGPCHCWRLRGSIGGVYGGGTADRTRAKDVRRGGYTPSTAVRRGLMGIDWMTGKELAQAIPPAYTEFIGHQLLDVIRSAACVLDFDAPPTVIDAGQL